MLRREAKYWSKPNCQNLFPRIQTLQHMMGFSRPPHIYGYIYVHSSCSGNRNGPEIQSQNFLNIQCKLWFCNIFMSDWIEKVVNGDFSKKKKKRLRAN